MEIGTDSGRKKRNWRAAALPAAQGVLYLIKADFIADALGSFREAFEQFTKENLTAEQAAWALWCETLSLALADALRACRVTVLQTDDELENAIAELLANAFAAGVTFGESALIDPTNFAPYQPVRSTFTAFLRRIDPEMPADGDEEALRRKLDESLRRSLVQAWSGNLDRYGQITARFEGPVAEGAKRQAAWMRHYAWIRDKFENAPVFSPDDLELKVKLRDVYIPLRGVWHEELVDPDEEQSKVPEREDARERKKKRIANVRMLRDLVQEWLHAPASPLQDPIRIVAGGPGSGKSSFARAFASETLLNHWRVVFIELQHMRLSGNLRDDLTKYFYDRNSTGAGFYDDPLNWRTEDTTPYLLVFDGLDELARGEDRATDLTRRFIANLQWMLRQSGDATRSMKALVLGRSGAAEEGRKDAELPLETLLHVLPYRPPTRRDLVLESTPPSLGADASDSAAAAEDVRDESNLLVGDTADQRRLYWTYWMRANQHDSAEVPEGLTHTDLDALNAEPLLLHLLIVSGYLAPDKWRIAADNRNVVYEAIFEKVYQRDKSAGKWSAAKIDREDFFTLMECLGLATWAGGGRTGSDKDFERIRASHAAGKRERKFKAIPNADLRGVAVQFYTRQDLGDTGFEFIHKSFGEYLIARALLAAAERARDRLEDSNEETTAKEWVQISGGAEVTDEILRFLRDETRRLSVEKTKDLKEALQDLMSWILWSGMPAHVVEEAGSYRDIESRQRHAEGALLAVLNACAKRLAASDPDAALLRLNWPDDHALLRTVERLQISRQAVGPISKCLSHLSAPAARKPDVLRMRPFLVCVDLYEADLEGADLAGAILIRADLSGSNLTGATLAEADLNQAFLQSANLLGADLQRAILYRATLEGSNLQGANLQEANLQGANLQGAVLQAANLQGADLRAADLQGARLQGARLQGANLQGANLQGANLQGANLKAADLQAADLQAADLQAANLTEADLRKARLEGANLAGTNLAATNLEGAKR